ncbi:TPA: hypothetical protein I7122_05920 [Vibrio vulnificus]|nr:hypothetical protein [Vibrio vulnificus]HAS6260236.1 hypothetical protein [Vibrio vulnificus]HAS8440108.1 hypothetical protein [Vibrio vulnificus]
MPEQTNTAASLSVFFTNTYFKIEYRFRHETKLISDIFSKHQRYLLLVSGQNFRRDILTI